MVENEELEKAMSVANFGIWQWLPKKNKVVFSTTARKLHGFNKTGFDGKFSSFMSSIYFADRHNFEKTLRNSLQDKTNLKVTYRVVNKKQIKWLESTGLAIKDKVDGYKLIGTSIDITRRVEFQERLNAQLTISNELSKATSLKQISQKLLMIISNTFGWEMGALWLKNVDSNMMLETIWPTDSKTANTLKDKTNQIAAHKRIGILNDVEKTGLPLWSENVIKSGISKRKNLFKKALIKSTFIMPILDNERVIGALEFYSTVKKPKDDSAISILYAIKNNIGQVIEKQRILRQNDSIRKQMQTIFNNVPFGITVENSAGEILNANKEVAEIFNKKSENQLIGKNIETVFNKYKIFDQSGIELKFEDRPAKKILDGIPNVEATLTFINRKTGRKQFLLIRATLSDNVQKEQTVIKSYKDITETLEEQRQRDFFVGILSHELKNPIASIKAYSQLLKIKIGDKKQKIYSYADSIESQTNRVAKLMNDIFDMTKFTSGKFVLNRRKINLDKIVQKIIANFRLTANGREIVQKGKSNTNLMVDEDHLVQVLVNLLSNANKYSSRTKRIDVIIKKSKDYVNIIVKDYGIGVAQKYHNEIFKFFRVIPSGHLNKRHGLGMGLALAKSIVKAHGGDILLKSKLKSGSEFIVKFPIIKN